MRQGRWYYDKTGRSQGPVTQEELFSLRQTGAIGDDTAVWQEGMIGWRSYAQAGLPELLAGVRLSSEEAAASEPPVLLVPKPTERPQPPALIVSDGGWQDIGPHPWRRLFARQIDLLLHSTVMTFLAALIMALVNEELAQRAIAVIESNRLVSSFFGAIIAIPLSALVLGLAGTTLGKWLLGVRVTLVDGRPIGLARALTREFRVWVFGLGMMIPIVALIAQVVSYNRLNDPPYRTAWDESEIWVVTHRPEGAIQLLLGICGVILFIAGIAWLYSL